MIGWSGWVKLYRRLAFHSIWTGERFSRGQAWVDLILLAEYSDHVVVQGNLAVTVKRGQVLTSQVALATRWRWTRDTVRSFLLLLKSLGMVAIQTSKATDTGYTLVTLLQYELYQGDGHAALELPSSIESAIQTSIHPASTQHPAYTLKKKGKKVENGKKAEGEDQASRIPDQTPSPCVPPGGEHVRPGGRTSLSPQPQEPGEEPGPAPTVTGRRVGAGAPRPPRSATSPPPSRDELLVEKRDVPPPLGLGYVPPLSEKSYTRTAGKSLVSRKELTHIESILPAVVPGTPDGASEGGRVPQGQASPPSGCGDPENGRPDAPAGPPAGLPTGIRTESHDVDALIEGVYGPPSSMHGIPGSRISLVEEEDPEVKRKLEVLCDHLKGVPLPLGEHHVRRLVSLHYPQDLIERAVAMMHGRGGGGSG